MSLQWTPDTDETRSMNRFESEYDFKQDPYIDYRYRRAIMPLRERVREWIAAVLFFCSMAAMMWWGMKHGG